MARVMLSAGMLASRAASTAERRGALWSGSPPPLRAATVTSRMSLVKSTPLVAPIASFLRLILVHRLWPDMAAALYQLSWPGSRGSARLAAPPCRFLVGRDVLVALQAFTVRTLGSAAGEFRELDRQGSLQDQTKGRRPLVRQPAPEQPLRRGAQDRRIRR